MSQAALDDTPVSSSDIHTPHTGAPSINLTEHEDVQLDLPSTVSAPQLPLALGGFDGPESAAEPTVEDVTKGNSSEGQVVECDQPVSLDPDAMATEKGVESSQLDQEKGWGGWGSWGKSLLSNATSTVGQSLSSVKVKAGEALRLHRTSLGEEAREEGERVEEERRDGGEEGHSGAGPGPQNTAGPSRGVLSTITHAVQNTGKTVISGGLDALEFIGKKTMTVLAESDPGFKKTKILMQKTVSLSQMLKEAKEKERARLGSQPINEPTAHYGILFDDFQGLSHLEALEILSNESEVKVQAILCSLEEEELEVMKKALIAIKDIFIGQVEEEGKHGAQGETREGAKEGETACNGDLSSQIHCATALSADGEEFVNVLTELLFDLHVAATPDKLNKARMKAYEWVRKVEQPVTMEIVGTETEGQPEPRKAEVEETRDAVERIEEMTERKESQEDFRSVKAVYLSSVGSLAEVTARSIEQLHKVAELILHGQDLEKPAREQAHILTRLTSAMCNEVDCLAKRFSDTLLTVGGQSKAEEVNPLLNSVLLEGSNSTNYIQNAFQLLLPVLQVSHIQAQQSRTDTEAPSQSQH